MNRCADCDTTITDSGGSVNHRTILRRSNAHGQRHRCVDCAYLHGYEPSHRPTPRYCVCQPGYRRTPHLPWQCDFCLRRINPRYDDRIPHEVSA